MMNKDNYDKAYITLSVQISDSDFSYKAKRDETSELKVEIYNADLPEASETMGLGATAEMLVKSVIRRYIAKLMEPEAGEE